LERARNEVKHGRHHLPQPRLRNVAQCAWPDPNTGIEPHVIEYLKTPPTRLLLRQLIDRMGVSVRSVLREKGTPYQELGLGNPALTDDELLDAIISHPILINRPIVVTPRGVRLCRPSETVLDLLPPQLGEFRKEDGELVIDATGRRAATA